MNAFSSLQNPRYAETMPDIVSWHGRFTRVVAVDVPHHVTQRGNGRRFVLDSDADRTIYLKLLRENSRSTASPSLDIASCRTIST